MTEIHTHTEEVEEVIVERGSKWLRSKSATWTLAGISVAESMFAPIIIDPFLIALILAERARWVWYTSVAIFSSVLGGLAGYALGALFFDTIGVRLLSFFGFAEEFALIADKVDANGFIFVIIGAVTPVPYKLVAIAGGLLELNIVTFIVASILGRTIRLGTVGYITYKFGPKAMPILRRHVRTIAGVIGILLIMYIVYKTR